MECNAVVTLKSKDFIVKNYCFEGWANYFAKIFMKKGAYWIIFILKYFLD